ncbi:MAG: hypothetical protein EBT34_03545 [Acetobacteraceae bacterium]|nr:hypothetical protein [Acetobacteraceae bacterium]NBS42801.1 hypothetical protein [Acetobacteraceae bacterium]
MAHIPTQDEAARAFNINRSAQNACDLVAPLCLIQALVVDGIHQILPGLVHKGGGAGNIHLLRMGGRAGKAHHAGQNKATM